MSRVPALLDTVIHLRRASQIELAAQAGIHQSNLSRFLSGETDIRISSLEKILESLDLSLEAMLENEIDKLIGKNQSSNSLGAALELLLKETDPIAAKTLIETLTSRVKPSKNKTLSSALEIVQSYKTKIKTVRRN